MWFTANSKEKVAKPVRYIRHDLLLNFSEDFLFEGSNRANSQVYIDLPYPIHKPFKSTSDVVDVVTKLVQEKIEYKGLWEGKKNLYKTAKKHVVKENKDGREIVYLPKHFLEFYRKKDPDAYFNCDYNFYYTGGVLEQLTINNKEYIIRPNMDNNLCLTDLHDPEQITKLQSGCSTPILNINKVESDNWQHLLVLRQKHKAGASAMDTSRTSMIKFNSSNSEGGSEHSKKMYCCRQLLHITECMNTSVLDCAVTFTCDKNVCVYGIQVPAQIPMEDDRQPQLVYPELLYAHLLDADGSRLTYTHFTSRVNYRSLIEISFNRPVYIQRNKVYKVGVVLNKIGYYPIGTYPSQSTCNGVVFSFSQGQCGDSVRDGLIRSIIFSIPSANNSSSNPGVPGDHNKLPNII